jgi:hypothetical protein
MAMEVPEGAPRTDERARDERVYRITGLADLLPDWILPPEGKDHVRNARREMLLAARSVLDACIDRLERGATVRRTPTRIEIE